MNPSTPFSPLDEEVYIPKTSTEPVFINNTNINSGSYIIFVSDPSDVGAKSIFVGCRSAPSPNNKSGSYNFSRLASSRGSELQRIDAEWVVGEKIKIFQRPAGSGEGNYTYKVRVLSGL